MIELKDINKSFGTLHVLKDVSAIIQPSQVTAIIGASGAGKTTLLQIMGTLDTPDSGKVLIDGIDVFSLREKEIADFRNRNIGFVFQFHQLLPEFSAVENVALPAMISGISTSKAKARAEELLDYLGLKERMHHTPTTLSGGERQRVAVARALINSPKVILADEPTGSLDSSNKEDLRNLFLRLRDDFHHTIVIVTHDESLAAIADDVIHMCDGRIITNSTT